MVWALPEKSDSFNMSRVDFSLEWRLLSIYLCVGNLCMVTGGANLGRIGVITNRERHPGSFDVVHVKDSTGNSFATRLSNIFVIGKVREIVLSSADNRSVLCSPT